MRRGLLIGSIAVAVAVAAASYLAGESPPPPPGSGAKPARDTAAVRSPEPARQRETLNGRFQPPPANRVGSDRPTAEPSANPTPGGASDSATLRDLASKTIERVQAQPIEAFRDAAGRDNLIAELRRIRGLVGHAVSEDGEVQDPVSLKQAVNGLQDVQSRVDGKQGADEAPDWTRDGEYQPLVHRTVDVLKDQLVDTLDAIPQP